MSDSDLELIAPYPAWEPAAWRGTATSGEVLVLRGPEGATEDRLAEVRASLEDWVWTDPRLLCPVDVVIAEARLCWIYPSLELLAVDRLLGSGSYQLPVSVAAEVVASVAELILGLGIPPDRVRGPEPTDVLLDAAGRVHLLGCGGARSAHPGLQDPSAVDGERALVYRLGALFSWLTALEPPERKSNQAHHDAAVRRALIRVMSRPGPIISERFANWFRAVRSWNADERPPLSRLPGALRQLSEELGPSVIETYAHGTVLNRISETQSASISTPLLGSVPEQSSQPSPLDSITDHGWEPSDSLERSGDDSTAEAPLFPAERTPAIEDAGILRSPFDQGRSGLGMPVRVGPPPSVARSRPSLPRGFLDIEGASEPSGSMVVDGPPRYSAATVAVLVVLTTGLLLIGGFLTVYLLDDSVLSGGTHEPQLAGLIGTEDPTTRVLVVHNPAGAALLVQCGDRQTRTTGDAILPTEVPGCRVTAVRQGRTEVFEVQVVGITEVDCFDRVDRCVER